MKRRSIILLESARQDLRSITIWLAQNASSKVAHRYIERIQQRISRLEYGAERGTIRGARTGVRLIGLLPSVSIAFTVKDESVYIMRVIYGGQNWQADLTADDDDGDD